MALSDLMSEFRGQGTPAPAANPPANTQTTPGNIPANTAVGSNGNGTVPPNTGTEVDTNTNADASPLDEFKGLWENDPNAQPPEEFKVLGEINPQKIMEAAGKVNFAKVVKPEDIAAIKNGGDEAVAALGRALNTTSQAVYAQSAVASSKLIEQATSKIEQKIMESLPAKIKSLSFGNSLQEDNPAYSHPAAQPVVNMIKDQIAAKFPNASTSELKQMSQEYFTRMLSAVSGADKKALEESTKQKSGETNWAKEFGLE